jgi:hypothetical protein
MKKPVFIILLCLALFGCVSNGGSNRKSNDVAEDYRTGTSGLMLSFMDGVPPDKILASSSLNVMIQINNKGAFNIEDASLYLSGYDKRYFFGQDQMSKVFSIEGRSQYNPDGDIKDIIEFKDDQIENVPKEIDSFQQTIKATACYYYETSANPEICINPNQYSATSTEDVCQINAVSLNNGQGAPIEVTKVEEELMDQKVVLKIYVRNSGGGTPFVADKANCHTSLKFNEIDMIQLKEVGFSNYDLTSSCRPNPLRLSSGTGFFVCSKDLGELGKNSFVTPLKIRLGYNYRESITKTVDIINI